MLFFNQLSVGLRREVDDHLRREAGGELPAGGEGDGVAALGEQPPRVHAELALAHCDEGRRPARQAAIRQRDERPLRARLARAEAEQQQQLEQRGGSHRATGELQQRARVYYRHRRRRRWRDRLAAAPHDERIEERSLAL